MHPASKATLRRSRSSASHRSVNKREGPPPLLFSIEPNPGEISPTLIEDHSLCSLFPPSPLSPLSRTPSSSSSIQPPFPFPEPSPYKQNGENDEEKDHILNYEAKCPPWSEVHYAVPESPVHTPLTCGDPFQYPIQMPKSGCWETAYNLAKAHDKAMCDAWKEDIDKLLVFGGLFAATVVAFLIVSYQLLQPTPDDLQKATSNMLVNIIRQYVNGTLLENDIHFPAPPTNFHPSADVLRMNVAWFLSMTMALSAVLVGTICLQWIREYQRDSRVNPKMAFAIRQMRWDGLQAWKVPTIISSLPIILQVSLLLFFWGLLEFLWSLNSKVTKINSVVIAVIFFFMAATLFLPALQVIFISCDKLRRQGQCAFKSPLALVFTNILFWLVLQFINLIRWQVKSNFQEDKKKLLEVMLHTRNWDDWVSFENQFQSWRTESPRSNSQVGNESRDIAHGLAWLGHKYLHTHDAIYALYHILRRVPPSTSANTLKTLIAKSGFSSFADSALSATASYGREFLDDLHSAIFLSHMASSSKDPHIQEALRLQRTELFIRIANYGATESTRLRSPGDATQSFIEQCIGDKEYGINPFVDKQDYLKLPEDMMVHIVVAFKIYLNQAHVLHDVLWDITKHIVIQFANVPSQPPSNKYLINEVDSLNEDLHAFLDHVRDRSRHYAGNSQHEQLDRQRVREYVFAIKDHKHMGRRFASNFRSLREGLARSHCNPI